MNINLVFSSVDLRQFVENILRQRGYKQLIREKFIAASSLKHPFYTQQLDLCSSIYGGKVRCDFVLYHPTKHPDFLIIESKWQQTSGSVDEKFPYLVENIKKQYPYNTLIVIDGGGYKRNALEWMKNQVDDKLIGVYGMDDFQHLAHEGLI